MNTWITKADPKRIIPRDYLIFGPCCKLQADRIHWVFRHCRKRCNWIAAHVDVYQEIAKSYFAKKKYKEAGDAYDIYASKSRNAKLTDHFYAGMSYYFGFIIQDAKGIKDPKAPRTDSALLVKADSAFSYVSQKAGANTPAIAYLYRARIADLHETDRNNIKGFAKPLL